MNFFQRTDKMTKIKKSLIMEKDKIDYEVRDVLISANFDKDGKVDEDDYVVEKKAVEVGRVDMQEYVNSFREDVGIANILKKVALSGDVSMLNQVERTALPLDEDGKEMIQDVTALQNGDETLAKIGDNMKKGYEELPEDLKAGRSLEKFLETVSKEEIAAFVAKYNAAQTGGKQDGE